MDLYAIHIEIGLNVMLVFCTEGEWNGRATYAMVSFAAWDVPVVRFADHEYSSLREAFGEAWGNLVINPDTPLKMSGVGGQVGWIDYLSGNYGVGFAFVLDALEKGEDTPAGATLINLQEWLKARGIDPAMI